MGQHDNILKAISKGELTLSPEEKNRNYQIFDELMKKGISLDTLLKQAGEKTSSGIDTELFTVMEDAVKDDDAVIAARKKAGAVKSQVISDLCIKDDRYRKALEEYKKTVSEVYIKNKEKTKDLKAEETSED